MERLPIGKESIRTLLPVFLAMIIMVLSMAHPVALSDGTDVFPVGTADAQSSDPPLEWKNTGGDVPGSGGGSGDNIAVDSDGNVYFFAEGSTDDIVVYSPEGSKIAEGSNPENSNALDVLEIDGDRYVGVAADSQFITYHASNISQIATNNFNDDGATDISAGIDRFYVSTQFGDTAAADPELNPYWTTSTNLGDEYSIATEAETLAEDKGDYVNILSANDGSKITEVTNFDDTNNHFIGAGPDNFYASDGTDVEQIDASDGSRGWTTGLSATVVDVEYESGFVVVGRDNGQVTVLDADNGDIVTTFDTGEAEVDVVDAYTENGKLNVYAGDSTENLGLWSKVASTEEPDSVSGYTQTENGEELSDVTVTAKNESGGAVATDTTDSVGKYSLSLENGTYDIEATKDGYLSDSQEVTVEGNDIEGVDFELTELDSSMTIRTRDYLEHGQTAAYTVTIENNTGRYNVTEQADVRSTNESVFTVNQDTLEIEATNDTSINQRETLIANYTDGEGNNFTQKQNVTVANKTVDNVGILPTGARLGASIEDSTLQVIIVATMIGAGVAFLSRAFAGLAAQTLIMALGWLGGMVGNGMVIVSFMIALFIGLNVATNIDYQVRAR